MGSISWMFVFRFPYANLTRRNGEALSEMYVRQTKPTPTGVVIHPLSSLHNSDYACAAGLFRARRTLRISKQGEIK